MFQLQTDQVKIHASVKNHKNNKREAFSAYFAWFTDVCAQEFLYLCMLTKKSPAGAYTSVWMYGGLQRKCLATLKSYVHQKYRLGRIVSSSGRR